VDAANEVMEFIDLDSFNKSLVRNYFKITQITKDSQEELD
jgi:hypothetical protein